MSRFIVLGCVTCRLRYFLGMEGVWCNIFREKNQILYYKSISYTLNYIHL